MGEAAARSIQTVAIVSTGSEILQGLYADSNACYLAARLSSLGLQVVALLAAPDNHYYLEKALRYTGKIADLVICTGGLGPTEDDLTRDVISKLWKVPLEKDAGAIEMMRERFRARGGKEMPAGNEVQALIPSGSVIFYNKWGTAPGFYLQGNDSVAALMALPGPPKEMQPMFESAGISLLRKETTGRVFSHTRTLHTFGEPESSVNERCKDLFRSDPRVCLTILAKPYGVDLRIHASTDSEGGTLTLLGSFEQQIRSRLFSHEVYGVDEETLQFVVAGLLMSKALTVTAAESCTGGLIAKLLTDVPGSSAYLKQSHVVYADEAKSAVVGVRPETLARFGAVSEQTARELAEGARRIAVTDFGIGVTGISGPAGGSPEKPVGLTFIAIADSTGTIVRRLQFLGDREMNRLWAAQSTLHLLWMRLLTTA